LGKHWTGFDLAPLAGDWRVTLLCDDFHLLY